MFKLCSSGCLIDALVGYIFCRSVSRSLSCFFQVLLWCFGELYHYLLYENFLPIVIWSSNVKVCMRCIIATNLFSPASLCTFLHNLPSVYGSTHWKEPLVSPSYSSNTSADRLGCIRATAARDVIDNYEFHCELSITGHYAYHWLACKSVYIVHRETILTGLSRLQNWPMFTATICRYRSSSWSLGTTALFSF